MRGTTRIVLDAMNLVTRLAAPVPLMEQGAISWFNASHASPTAGFRYWNHIINGSMVISGDDGRSLTICADLQRLQLRLIAKLLFLMAAL